MQVFTDTEGREWEVRVTTRTLERVRDIAGIDLGDQEAFGDTMKRLMANYTVLGSVLWAVVQPQAERDSRKVTRDGFLEALAGQSVADAQQALLHELTAFFPPPMGPALARELARAERAMADAMSALESASASGPSSTSTQDSSESTQQS